MINKYNIINTLMVTSIGGSVLTLLFSLFVSFTGITPSNDWEILVHITIASNLFFIALMLYYWISGQFKDVFNSYLATRRMRRYIRLEDNEVINLQTGQPVSARDRVVKKANRALWTVTVTYSGNDVKLRWKLPSNHQSKNILKEIFPDIKEELQSIDNNLFFSNITQEKGRWYSAKGSFK